MKKCQVKHCNYNTYSSAKTSLFCWKHMDGSRRSKGAIEKKCPICLRKFFSCPSRNQKTCSVICRGALQRKRIYRPCAYCNKKMPVILCLNVSKKYCSKSCKSKAMWVSWRFAMSEYKKNDINNTI